MENRHLIYFVIAGLFLGIFFGNVTHNVNATVVTYTEDFDSYYDRNQVDNGWLHTQGGYGQGYGVTVSNYHSAYNSYYTNEANVTNFNFTSANNNFAGCDFWIKPHTSSTSYGSNYKSINFMNGSTIAFKVYLWRIDNDDHICISSVGGVRTQLFDNSVYFHVVLTVVSSNIVNVSVYNLTNVYKGGFTDGTFQPVNSVNRMQIDKYIAQTISYNIDDFSLILGTSGGFSGCGSTEGLNGIGITTFTSSTQFNYNTILKKYAVPMNTTISVVDLQVTDQQYNGDNDLDNYHLGLLNIDLGTPDCFFINNNGEGYILRWIINIDITEEDGVLWFYFVHNTVAFGSTYWDVYSSDTARDWDGDGFAEFDIKSLELTFHGWEYIHKLTYNRELGMRFYHGAIIVLDDTSPYEDMLTSTKLSFTEYENIPLIWFVSAIDYTNYLHVFNITGQLNIQNYPKVLSGFTGITGFMPINSGWYRFELRRNSVVIKTLNITVTDNTEDYILSSAPNPSNDQSYFTVYYKYNRDDGKNGIITVSDFSWITPENINDGVYYKEVHTITVNSTGSFQVFGDSTDAFINMYVKVTNLTFLKVKSLQHHVGAPTEYSIDVLYDSLPLINGVATQRFYVYQNALDSVHVILNSKDIKDVSGIYSTTFDYDITTSGVKNATLVLISVNGTIVLDYKEFIVTKEILPPEDITSGLSMEQKLIIGFGIAIGFLSIPLLIQFKSGTEINIFVYLFFGVLGLVIATVFGFLNPIILGSIILIMILIIVIMWLKGKSE